MKIHKFDIRPSLIYQVPRVRNLINFHLKFVHVANTKDPQEKEGVPNRQAIARLVRLSESSSN